MNTCITLTEVQRQALKAIIDSGKSEHRMHLRAQIVIDAADGLTVSSSSRRLGVTRPMVIKWRKRFASLGVDGLRDAPRSGQPAKYGREFESLVLATLDEAPPEGYSRWNGNLLARHLGVKADQIWRIMRKNGIDLARRRSWCVSTDPEFASKAADIVGLYLNPPAECSCHLRRREAMHTGDRKAAGVAPLPRRENPSGLQRPLQAERQQHAVRGT